MRHQLSNFDNREEHGSDIEIQGESLTVQSQAADADINTIVRKFGLTGQLPQVAMPPLQGDFEGVDDFQSAMNMILASQRSFMAMPAEVRKRFNNDPAEFVDFCSNRDNLEEMRRLGLAVPAPVEVNSGVPAS